MNIFIKGGKYLSAFILSCVLVTVLCVPLTSASYLIWLNSVDMPISLGIVIQSISHDYVNFSPIFFLVSLLAFICSFMMASALYLPFRNTNLISLELTYGLAAAFGLQFAIYLSIELLFGTQLIAGNRVLVGKIFHFVFAFISGYIFGSLIKKI